MTWQPKKLSDTTSSETAVGSLHREASCRALPKGGYPACGHQPRGGEGGARRPALLQAVSREPSSCSGHSIPGRPETSPATGSLPGALILLWTLAPGHGLSLQLSGGPQALLQRSSSRWIPSHHWTSFDIAGLPFPSEARLHFFLHKTFRSDHSLSHVWLFATPWIAARQASLSITNSRVLSSAMLFNLCCRVCFTIFCDY